MEIALHQTPENDYYRHKAQGVPSVCVKIALIDVIHRSAITWHSTHYDFGNVKSKAKRWSLAGKYDYIISEYFSEFPTENVGNLVVGA